MLPFWVVFWALLPDVASLSAPEKCDFYESSSSQSASPLLESLKCYNDYESNVVCKWMKQGNQTLQLWSVTKDGRKLCLPFDAADAAEERTDNCIFEVYALGHNIKYTVTFSMEPQSLCSPVLKTPLNLQQHLKALPPVNLSTHDAGEGARRLCWSSPYPSSSSLNRNLSYQLSYRTQGQDGWTMKHVKTSSTTLERSSLLPGHRYEARVRVRASVGQWSDWSPVVTWQTEQDVLQPPALHCVLRGEREVMCSWEVRAELADFITYQLECQDKQTAPCCENLTVSSESGGTMRRYSCLLMDPERQLLSLRPMQNAKTFKAQEHIRPKPPGDVKIEEKGNNWNVHWVKPSTPYVSLAYEVCYYRTEDPESPVLENTSEEATSWTIPGNSLTPSQKYKVKVRSVLGSRSYRGIPSEWTEPLDWTSNEESWSYTTFISILITVIITTVFLTLYCTIPACQRHLLLWVDSVPSPRKSKIICEIKSATCKAVLLSEKTSISKVQHLDGMSAGSCDVLPWPIKDTEKKGQDEGCRDCNNQPPSSAEVNGSDVSSISFSGPYIVFESLEELAKSVELQSKDTDPPCSPPMNFTLYGDGYVWLPRHIVSMSAQDLTSHSGGSTNHSSVQSVEDARPRPGAELHSGSRSDLRESISEDRLPEYTPGPPMAWPQAGTIQPSGYCHLPAAFMTAPQ
ncbi:cytokine receptor common subunit beta [Salarias fasciatus]|uniref:Fibronectin type-III domain-containing protein n=1 Tax=Salarias fasciatus TaxID=181472 RepID=A0A672G0B5_SALFA|nr:cytokine receptor common subunit beta [Salarias fasciatus]XP_029946067.1 cytokine receptor common subunit beta [Salarias fasciatus]XP_029946068.1 cytokine receptor common subunit beta [Salarias fasciatus]XP_029946069.1 cytokine receptor common subunit beta [Salarias fasciatus]